MMRRPLTLATSLLLTFGLALLLLSSQVNSARLGHPRLSSLERRSEVASVEARGGAFPKTSKEYWQGRAPGLFGPHGHHGHAAGAGRSRVSESFHNMKDKLHYKAMSKMSGQHYASKSLD